jgi:hypothetical protein
MLINLQVIDGEDKKMKFSTFLDSFFGDSSEIWNVWYGIHSLIKATDWWRDV